jgi:site-specific DNA-methyltransferase (adenine-specific)
MEAKRALRVGRERKTETKRKAEPPPPPPTNITIKHCDFRELDIPDESVDLVFTDPPYPKEFIPLWSDLSEFAARVLKPGHLLIAYCGQFWFPEYVDALREHLEYVWCGAVVTNGPHNVIQRKHIWTRSKPLLFFSHGKYEPGEWFEDTVFSEGRQKEEHDWQQSIGPAKDIIGKLLKPGDVVCDPFAGGGTTLVAAKECKCTAVGCDTDEVAVDTILRRFP